MLAPNGTVIRIACCLLFVLAAFAGSAAGEAPSTFLQLVVERGKAPAIQPADDGAKLGKRPSAAPAQPVARDTLSPKVGEKVRFRLNLPKREDWSTASLGQLQVRTFGHQVNLTDPPARAGEREFEYTFDQEGYTVVALCAGGAEARGSSDPWATSTYCTKLLVNVQPRTKGAGNPDASKRFRPRDGGSIVKMGLKVELLPYLAPYAIDMSADERAIMPVRVYFDGGAQKGVEVKAYAPSGRVQTVRTNSVGVANVNVAESGRWLVRYEKIVDGVTYTGDLVFDMPSNAGR